MLKSGEITALDAKEKKTVLKTEPALTVKGSISPRNVSPSRRAGMAPDSLKPDCETVDADISLAHMKALYAKERSVNETTDSKNETVVKKRGRKQKTENKLDEDHLKTADQSKLKALPEIMVTPPKSRTKANQGNSPKKTKAKVVSASDNDQSSPRRSPKESLSPQLKKSRTPSNSPSPTRRNRSADKSPTNSKKTSSSLKPDIPKTCSDSKKPVKRVRSPSAKFKEDMILDPFETTKKSPKKSPVKKEKIADISSQSQDSKSSIASPENQVKSPKRIRKPRAKKEDITSGEGDSPKKNNNVKEEDNKSPRKNKRSPKKEKQLTNKEKQSPEKEKDNNCEPKQGTSITQDNPSSAARVLNLDSGVTVIESLKCPLPSDFIYKYSYTKDSSSNPLALTDLISKVNSSIEGTDETLNNLFGAAEEPEYSDESVSFSPNNSESTNNESIDSDKTVTEFDNVSNNDGDVNADDKTDKDTAVNTKYIKKENLEDCADKIDIKVEEMEIKDVSAINEETDIDKSTELGINSEVSDVKTETLIGKDNEMMHKSQFESKIESDKKLLEENMEHNDDKNVPLIEEDQNTNREEKNIFDLFGLKLKTKKTKDNIKESSSDSKDTIRVEKTNIDIKPVVRNKVNGLDRENKPFENEVQIKAINIEDSCKQVLKLIGKETDKVVVKSSETDKEMVKNKLDKDDDDVMIISETIPNVVVVSDDETNTNKTQSKKTKFFSVNNIVEPKPMTVLATIEKEVINKKNAFVSEELEKYLDVNKENTGPLIRQKSGLSSSPPMNIKEQLNNAEPDFDEINGHIFLSFPTEQCLNAHIELEKKVEWLNDSALKKMTHLISMRERQQDQGTKRLTDVKCGTEQKQNFRGIPMRLQKYNKLLRQQLESILTGKPTISPNSTISKTPEKTSDITKIKGWKNKFENGEDMQEATGLHFSETGKLHWRTQDRLLKNLDPDDVKDIGLDLKKKRRKLINYSNKKKGASKASSNVDPEEDMEYEYDFDDPSIVTERDVYDENDELPKPDKVPYNVKYHSQHKYGARKMFVKKMGLDSKDELILKKLGTQKLPRESEEGSQVCKTKKGRSVCPLSKLTQSMAVAAVSALDRKLMTRAKAIAKAKQTKLDKKQKLKEKDTIDNEENVDETDDGKNKHKQNLKDEAVEADSMSESEEEGPEGYEEMDLAQGETTTTTTTPILPKTRSRARSITSLDQSIEKKGEEKTKDVRKKEKKRVGSPASCDKPGCRYGCICHLCKFSDSSEEKEADVKVKPPCDKEYCRLGCICDSIETTQDSEVHCRKPGCMLECKCPPKQPKPDIPKESRGKKKRNRGKGAKKKKRTTDKNDDLEACPAQEEGVSIREEGLVSGEENDNWEPPSKRKRGNTNARFANLPLRKTTYRVAKNLDAVSRKAMEVYASSEVYAEQKMRRRRSDPCQSVIQDYDQGSVPEDWRRTVAKVHTRDGDKSIPDLHDDMELTGLEPSYEISDESDGESFPTDEFNCARNLPYLGHYKPKLKPVRSQPTNSEARPKKSQPSKVINLVESDQEDNSGRTGTNDDKTTRSGLPSGNGASQLTASDKLKFAKKAEPRATCSSSKTNSSSKWKTQMVCLKAKKKSDGEKDADNGQPQSEIKLLEIISDCHWENDRTNMLSKISHIISKDYHANHLVMWGGYVLQFLPKADKPAVIPPELQSKLPNAMYSIRVRVTKSIMDGDKLDGKEPVNFAKVINNRAKREEKIVIDITADDDEKKSQSLKLQKRLIDKIKFAEKLRDLIILEEKKGPGVAEKKFSVSRDGIEKALKRYKTQLWKAYTGTSNMTLIQLKQAVEAAKSKNPSFPGEDKISCPSSTVTSEVTMPYAGQPLSSATRARIQSNQGLQVICQSGSGQQPMCVQPTNQNSFLSLGDLQQSKQARNPMGNLSCVTNNMNTNIHPKVDVSQADVLLIPVHDNDKSKWNPNANVLSAKMTMVPSAISTAQKIDIGRNLGRNSSNVGTRLQKPILNPALCGLANNKSPGVNGHSLVIQPQGKIMINAIQPVPPGLLSGPIRFAPLPGQSVTSTVMAGRTSSSPQPSIIPTLYTPITSHSNPSLQTIQQIPIKNHPIIPRVPGPGVLSTFTTNSGIMSRPLGTVPSNIQVTNGNTQFQMASPVIGSTAMIQTTGGQFRLAGPMVGEPPVSCVPISVSNYPFQIMPNPGDTRPMLQGNKPMIKFIPMTSTATPVIPSVPNSATGAPVRFNIVKPDLRPIIYAPTTTTSQPTSVAITTQKPVSQVTETPNVISTSSIKGPILNLTGQEAVKSGKFSFLNDDNKTELKSSEPSKPLVDQHEVPPIRNKRNVLVSESEVLLQGVGDKTDLCILDDQAGILCSADDRLLKEEIENEIKDFDDSDSEDDNSEFGSLGSSLKSLTTLADSCAAKSTNSKQDSDENGKSKTQLSASKTSLSDKTEGTLDTIATAKVADKQNTVSALMKEISGNNTEVKSTKQSDKEEGTVNSDCIFIDLNESDDQTENVSEIKSHTETVVIEDEDNNTDNLIDLAKDDSPNETRKRKLVEFDDDLEIGQTTKKLCVLEDEDSLKGYEMGQGDNVPMSYIEIDQEDESDEEDSDIDIMTLEDDLSVPMATQNRRKSQQTSLDHGDDFKITAKTTIPKKDVLHSPRLKHKVRREKTRREVLKRLFQKLEYAIELYNPGLSSKYKVGGAYIPKHYILQESTKLLNALKHRMHRLEECLEDGQSYQQSLTLQLQTHIDSFVKSGVPENIIKNFLKSVANVSSFQNQDDSSVACLPPESSLDSTKQGRIPSKPSATTSACTVSNRPTATMILTNTTTHKTIPSTVSSTVDSKTLIMAPRTPAMSVHKPLLSSSVKPLSILSESGQKKITVAHPHVVTCGRSDIISKEKVIELVGHGTYSFIRPDQSKVNFVPKVYQQPNISAASTVVKKKIQISFVKSSDYTASAMTNVAECSNLAEIMNRETHIQNQVLQGTSQVVKVSEIEPRSVLQGTSPVVKVSEPEPSSVLNESPPNERDCNDFEYDDEEDEIRSSTGDALMEHESFSEVMGEEDFDTANLDDLNQADDIFPNSQDVNSLVDDNNIMV